MPVETAADLAGMFDPDDHAVLAKYRPADGVPKVDVPVILSEPDVDVGTGIAGVQAHQRTALILVSDLDLTPARNDRLDIGEESFRVRKVTADVARKVYRLEIAPAT